MRLPVVVAERVAGDRTLSVSFTTGDGQNGGATLNVGVYPPGDVWGRVPADHDGRWFPSYDEAHAFAVDHGYLRTYYTSPELRARRVERARLAVSA